MVRYEVDVVWGVIGGIGYGWSCGQNNPSHPRSQFNKRSKMASRNNRKVMVALIATHQGVTCSVVVDSLILEGTPRGYDYCV